MAMRRRRFGRRRFGRKPKPYWISDTFSEASLDLDNAGGSAAVNTFLMAEYDDIEASTTTLRRMWSVRRIIVHIGYRAQSLANGLNVSYPWTTVLSEHVYKTDAEDTDNDMKTAAQGSLVQSGRVVHTGLKTVMGISPHAFSTSGAFPTVASFIPQTEIDWRGRIRMGPDDIIKLGIHVLVPLADISTYAAISMQVQSRCIVTLP